MARRKSYRDIHRQANDLMWKAGRNSTRFRKIMEIEKRYLNNIRNSRAFNRDEAYLEEYARKAYDNGFEDALIRGGYRGSYDRAPEYEEEVNVSAFPKLYERKFKRQYDREVYQQGLREPSRFTNARTGVNAAMAQVGG